MYTREVSEQICPLTGMLPDDRGPGTHYSDWVSLSAYHRAFFLLEVGDMGALSTAIAGLQQASDAAGTGVKAITGKVCSILSAAAGDDGLVGIELQTEELDVDGHFEYVRFYVTTAVNTVLFSAGLFGVESRFEPVLTTNWHQICH